MLCKISPCEFTSVGEGAVRRRDFSSSLNLGVASVGDEDDHLGGDSYLVGTATWLFCLASSMGRGIVCVAVNYQLRRSQSSHLLKSRAFKSSSILYRLRMFLCSIVILSIFALLFSWASVSLINP